jgi:hypothetical protein
VADFAVQVHDLFRLIPNCLREQDADRTETHTVRTKPHAVHTKSHAFRTKPHAVHTSPHAVSPAVTGNQTTAVCTFGCNDSVGVVLDKTSLASLSYSV